MIEKECSQCGLKKPLEDFSKDKYSKDGRTSQCKNCRKLNTKKSEKRNFEKYKNLSEEVIRNSVLTKRCSKCKQTKSGKEFAVDRKTKSGLYSRCTLCMREQCNEYDNKNRAQRNKSHRKHKRLKRYDPEYRLQQYQRGAKNRGLQFDIDIDFINDMWNKPCTYCGSEIDSIGLDRIDNSKGYTKENLCSCCFNCNQMKSTKDKNEWISHILKIANYYKE